MKPLSSALRFPGVGCLLLLSSALAGCDGPAADKQPAPHDGKAQESAIHSGAQHGEPSGDRHADSGVAQSGPGQSEGQQSWPRTLQTPKGPLTLQRAPERIVSTSVTITGTLLAIDAPVTGSGATGREAVADASASKVFGSDEVQSLGLALERIVTTYGDPTDPDTARLLHYLDATSKRNLVLTFGGGVNEVLRELIAMFGLGLPKVPR